ncbi:MAG: hypothetical protein ACJKSS_01695 [Patescibacteria group bacterium UBA2103]
MDIFWFGFGMLIFGIIVGGIVPEYVKDEVVPRVFFYIIGVVFIIVGALMAISGAVQDIPAAM